MIVTISLIFKVGGSILLVSNGLKLLSLLTKCECDDKIADFVSPILDFAYFIACIWGSVIVFGKYKKLVFLSIFIPIESA